MKLRIGILFLLLTKLSISYSASPIDADAYAYRVPILKGLTTNPIIRIKIAASTNNESTQIKELVCKMDASQLSDIEKISVYSSPKELFENLQTLGSIQPNKSKFRIPVSGLSTNTSQNIWVSIQLTAQAKMTNKIAFVCQSLVDASNNLHPIKQMDGPFSWYSGIAVRKAGEDQVNTYRIPGLVKTSKGTMIAVYDNRYKTSKDLPGNIDVAMSRSLDKGFSWEPMNVIMDMGEPNENNGVGDPAVLYDSVTHTIWAAAMWSKGNRAIADSKPGLSQDTTAQFVLVNSKDEGLTWSKPYSITASIKNPIWHIFFKDQVLVFK